MISTDDIAKLSAAERLSLIGELWDSLAEADAPLSGPQRDELVRRMSAFDAGKLETASWDALKAELAARKG